MSWWHSPDAVAVAASAARWIGAVMAVIILILAHRLTTLQALAKGEEKKKTEASIAEARAFAARLEQSQKPRRLSDEQSKKLITLLIGSPKGRVVIDAIKMDSEAIEFSEEIAATLVSAGFAVEKYSGPLLLQLPPGVWVGMKSLVDQPGPAGWIQHAFKEAGIECNALAIDDTDPQTTIVGIGPKK